MIIIYYNDRNKDSTSKVEIKKFKEGMNKLGFREWEIDDELEKIESLDKLKLINKDIQKSISRHKL